MEACRRRMRIGTNRLGQGSDTGVPLFNPESARSIENRKHHDTDIGEDGNPHVGNSDCAE